MPKALIALIGLLGVLLFPASVAAGQADEYLFQGGDEPFSGEHPVGMTMIGHDVNRPTKVNSFTITDLDWSCSGYVNELTLSMGVNPRATRTKRNDEGDLYFHWKGSGGIA